MEWDFVGFSVVDLTSIGFDIKATKSCLNLLSQYRTKKYSLSKITGAYNQIQQPQLPITHICLTIQPSRFPALLYSDLVVLKQMCILV